MKTLKIVLLSALIGASGVAMADYNGSRDDRMQSALDDYHRTHGMADARNPHPGPAARAENSIKRGGQAVKHGAQRAGHAVAQGARKTGAAIKRETRKLEGKPAQ